MNITVGENLGDLERAMRDKGRKVPALVRKGVIDATALVYTTSRGLMSQLIYNQPIPRVRRRNRALTKSGRKRPARNVAAWRRSGDLLRGERYYLEGSGVNTTGTIDNAVPYAKARHDLNRPSRVDGKTRRAPWRTVAVRRTTPLVKAIFEQTLRAGLNEPD